MSARLFSSSFKKVKDVTVQTPLETFGSKPEWISDRRAIYMDTRGNTSLVLAVPAYIAAMVPDRKGVTIQRDDQTGTPYIEGTSGIDHLTGIYSLLANIYAQRVMEAVAEKVIVIKAAYQAKDGHGRRVNRLPSFSDVYGGSLVGFNYGVRHKINGALFTLSQGRFYQCGYGDDLTRDAVILPWSQAAEDTCLHLHQGVKAMGQRMHDFLSQDTEALKSLLEGGAQRLLTGPQSE